MIQVVRIDIDSLKMKKIEIIEILTIHTEVYKIFF